MPTPKIDALCVEFIKRIPDQLQANFVIGTEALPDGYNITAVTIVDYVNRAMINLFNTKWQLTEGNKQKFISIFPELLGQSERVETPVYEIVSPYKDFHTLFSAIGTEVIDDASGDESGEEYTLTNYFKIRSEIEYTLFKSGKYKRYEPTETDAVIIQIKNNLEVFPTSLVSGMVFFYIKKPIDPETGLAFVQNGDNDSPFREDWHKEIIDIAYSLFLAETKQTE